MANIPLRQIRAVIAVCEEGSFTRAAQRENATQSGISQHVAAVERTLKVKLFERTTGGVTPTPAGLRYYKRCVEAVGTLEHAAEEARSLAGEVTGELRIGLMPTFTRAVLAPVLDDFVPRCPEVRLHIVEGYSGMLTEMVLNDQLDFAVVPAYEGTVGLRSRLLVRDREMLISGPRRGFAPLSPIRLADCAPLKFVVPGPDIGRGELIVNPLASPELHAEFVVIQPTRRTLSTQARLFLQRFEAEVAHIHDVWDEATAVPTKRKASA
jgi:LysR family tcuABC transcriptional regulator